MSIITAGDQKTPGNQNNTIDSHEHLVVTIDNLELKNLFDLRIASRINDHVRISFTATVPGETVDKEVFINNLGSNSKIVVGLATIQQANQLKLLAQRPEINRQAKQTGQIKNANQIKPFFKGVVTKVDFNYFRDDYLITVEGVSYTKLLDIELRQQTYQNAAMTYTELVDSILDNPKYTATHPGRVISGAFQGAAIGQIAVQMQETDWQYLIRLASWRYTGLVANPAPANGENPQFWFGVPEIDSEVRLTAAFYTIRKRINRYEEMLQNKTVDSLDEKEVLDYEVTGIRQYLQIGQVVKLNGTELRVCQITSRNDGDQLLHDYVLTAPSGLKQPEFHNLKLAGTSLTGTVIDRVQDTVKVFFDVDSKQSVYDAWLFPQTTPYAAEEHTGWYWMPEVGDQVKVYFPNENEKNAYVVSSMRKAGTAQTTDPDVKYLRTPRNKEMRFDNAGITVSTAKGPITETDSATGKTTTKEAGSNLILRLDHAKGITVQSDHTLNIKTKADLKITAKKLNISAGKLLEMKCKASYIKMADRIINIEGTVIDWPKASGGAVTVATSMVMDATHKANKSQRDNTKENSKAKDDEKKVDSCKKCTKKDCENTKITCASFWESKKSTWIYPLKKRVPISDSFASDRKLGRKHAGVDLNGNAGDEVLAVFGGTVLYTIIGYYKGTDTIAILHDDGAVCHYCEIGIAHRNGSVLKKGDKVKKGEMIGKIKAHVDPKPEKRYQVLHFEVYEGICPSSLRLTDSSNSSKYLFVTERKYLRRPDLIDPTGVQNLNIKK